LSIITWMGAGGLGSPKYAQPFQPMLIKYDPERGGYRRYG
jgi:hypothetical protein